VSERAAPFYCPYCGEENLRPFGELDDPHGQWRCDACRRAFRLRMIGLTRPGTDAGDSGGDRAS
jgi:transposase-like protein